VHASTFGSMLEFDWRLAGRTHDLQQALEKTRPQIVHFSGHGGSNGLVLLGADGRSPRPVDADVLRELFQKDRGSIRLVVLTACHSRPQAEAIKEVVGCAIGTRDQISDQASILFNAKFYSAIASGRSVQDAFERARLALRLEHPHEAEILELLHRPDVDPAKVVLVSRFHRFARIGATVAAALVVLLAVFLISRPPSIVDPPLSGGLRLGDCAPEGTGTPTAASVEPESPSESATLLAQAKAFCRAGNYDSAFAFFGRAAEEGAPEAMSFLAIAYLSGEGTKRDTVRGMFWLDRAARKGRDPRGMNALGVVYENDQGRDRRYYLARHWYEEAAKQGYAEAMRNLGRHYRMGLGGIGQSDSLALVWYQKAVTAGSVDAMVDIGRMYERGMSGRRDTGQALRFYRAAATAGSPLGMQSMGRAYQEAIGVRRDYAQARTWYLRGACAGSAEAMNNLGLLYQRGLGMAADRREAIEWFRRGAAEGSSGAAANLAKLERRGVGKVLALLDRPQSSPPSACAVL
ncbi:MAG TPA: CHAT domain-containing protein, partial [Longimicrobium sp.]|nr:CHAT domain-containing protein [Longimicrobium sp.]